MNAKSEANSAGRSALDGIPPHFSPEPSAVFRKSERSVVFPDEEESIVHHTARTPVSIFSNSKLLREGLLNLLSPYIALYLIGAYPGRFASAFDIQSLPNPPKHVVLLDGGLNHEAVVTWTDYWRGVTPPAQVIVVEMPNDIDTIVSFIEAGAGGYTLEGASEAEVVQTIGLVAQGLAECSPEVTAQVFAHLAGYASAARAMTAGQPPSLSSILIAAVQTAPIVPMVPMVPIMPTILLAPAPTALTLPTMPIPPTASTPSAMHFTPRELEVLGYICAGLGNQEIADALVIEINTVKRHVHNILEKLKEQLAASNPRYARLYAARFAIEQGWIAATPSPLQFPMQVPPPQD